MATIKLRNCTAMIGANAKNIWTERMSELALEMIWPLCTRSKNENDNFPRWLNSDVRRWNSILNAIPYSP